MLQRSNVANKRSMCAVYTVRKRHGCVMPMWNDRLSVGSQKSQESYLTSISKFIIIFSSHTQRCVEKIFLHPFLLKTGFDTILPSSDEKFNTHHKTKQYEVSVNKVNNC